MRSSDFAIVCVVKYIIVYLEHNVSAESTRLYADVDHLISDAYRYVHEGDWQILFPNSFDR